MTANAPAGTYLSQLDGKAPVIDSSDNEFVNRLLADMNQPSGSNPTMQMQQPPPPQGNSAPPRMIQSPNPQSTYPMMSDPSVATAHMIGHDNPTPADFANMVHSQSYPGYGSQGMTGMGGMGGMGGGAMGYYGGSGYGGDGRFGMNPPQLIASADKGYMFMEIFQQIKEPLIIALIVFVVSLPAFNVLIAYYVPSLLKVGGEMSTAGLGVKAVFGGFLFWFIRKVLVPLIAV